MIELTKLNGKVIFINPHLLETMEEGAEVRLFFLSNKVIIVKEKPEEIVEKVIEYRKKLGINAHEI